MSLKKAMHLEAISILVTYLVGRDNIIRLVTLPHWLSPKCVSDVSKFLQNCV